MKKTIIAGLVLFSLFFVIGCDSCPSSCNDYNLCTSDKCSQETDFKCIHDQITPCCGNNVCESNENFELCSKDCEIPEEMCLEFDKTEENGAYIFTYKYHNDECKSNQILYCRDALNFLDMGNSYGPRKMCLLNLALDYRDYSICDYLTSGGISRYKMDAYSEYWYCMGVLRYGSSACSHIDSQYWLKECLNDTD